MFASLMLMLLQAQNCSRSIYVLSVKLVFFPIHPFSSPYPYQVFFVVVVVMLPMCLMIKMAKKKSKVFNSSNTERNTE